MTDPASASTLSRITLSEMFNWEKEEIESNARSRAQQLASETKEPVTLLEYNGLSSHTRYFYFCLLSARDRALDIYSTNTDSSLMAIGTYFPKTEVIEV